MTRGTVMVVWAHVSCVGSVRRFWHVCWEGLGCPTAIQGAAHHALAVLGCVPQESCLAGRQVLVGYPGWLDSHGMPYHQRNADVMDLLRGGEHRIDTLLERIPTDNAGTPSP